MPPRHDILTDIPGKPGRFWGDHTTLVGPSRPPAWLVRCLGRRWADNLAGAFAAIRMFLRRRHSQGVVTDGGASGTLFAFLQGLIPWHRKPHVMIDCNWYLTGNRFRDWLKAVRLRFAARSVKRFVVWASHEIEDYSRAFGIPTEKFAYVPFHDTVRNYQYEIRDDGYLFAGGNYDRDYPTLIEAVRSIEVPVWIATTRPEQLAGVDVPANVRVEGTSIEGFRQAMAAARLVVIPMKSGLLHSGGQQTCLNAMLLGKPTIAVGRPWATDFITNGSNGIIVDYDDSQSLQKAIRWVLEKPRAARLMAKRGQAHAARFTTERTMRAVYDLVKTSPEWESSPDRSWSRRPAEQRNDVTLNGNGS